MSGGRVRRRGAAGARPPERAAAEAVSGGTVEGRSVLELLRELRAGSLDPRHIGAEERRACVAYLTAEGYTVPEIAQILKTSDRTVHRDRERVRADNALRPSLDLIGELVGQLSCEAAASVQRLRRLSREKEAPLAARIEAERSAWTVFREYVQSMQRLGYLPMAVPSLRADVTHRFGDDQGDALASVESMRRELERIESIQREAPSRSPEMAEGVEQVRGVLLQLEAGRRLAALKRQSGREGPEEKEVGDGDGA